MAIPSILKGAESTCESIPVKVYLWNAFCPHGVLGCWRFALLTRYVYTTHSPVYNVCVPNVLFQFVPCVSYMYVACNLLTLSSRLGCMSIKFVSFFPLQRGNFFFFQLIMLSYFFSNFVLNKTYSMDGVDNTVPTCTAVTFLICMADCLPPTNDTILHCYSLCGRTAFCISLEIDSHGLLGDPFA